MKRVFLLGTTGATGKYIMAEFQNQSDTVLTAYVRNPAKMTELDSTNVNVVYGDVTDTEKLKKVMQEQDVVLASLKGDTLSMAKSIIGAMKDSPVSRIIWMTGMGIHHEIKGVRGKMLDLYAKSRPDYIQAADLIAACGVTYTLLRGPVLKNGSNDVYYLTTEDEQPRQKDVDRVAVAKYIADMVFSETGLGENQSLGITN